MSPLLTWRLILIILTIIIFISIIVIIVIVVVVIIIVFVFIRHIKHLRFYIKELVIQSIFITMKYKFNVLILIIDYFLEIIHFNLVKNIKIC